MEIAGDTCGCVLAHTQGRHHQLIADPRGGLRSRPSPPPPPLPQPCAGRRPIAGDGARRKPAPALPHRDPLQDFCSSSGLSPSFFLSCRRAGAQRPRFSCSEPSALRPLGSQPPQGRGARCSGTWGRRVAGTGARRGRGARRGPAAHREGTGSGRSAEGMEKRLWGAGKASRGETPQGAVHTGVEVGCTCRGACGNAAVCVSDPSGWGAAPAAPRLSAGGRWPDPASDCRSFWCPPSPGWISASRPLATVMGSAVGTSPIRAKGNSFLCWGFWETKSCP